jgi:beta-glucanase (GH16 family)
MVMNGADFTGVNFGSAVQVIPSLVISGTISPSAGGALAAVNLNGTSTASTIADASGNYSFTALAPGSYIVTPSSTGFLFTPPSQTVTLTTANAVGVNFIGAPSYSISGILKLSSNGTGAGATVTLSGASSATTTTDSTGAYSFTGLVNGAYTVTPTETTAIFAPVSQNVIINSANSTGVNFTTTALLLYDDFVAPSLSSQWLGMNYPGDSSNKELECYTPSQDSVTGGYLVIASSVQSVTCGQSPTPMSYASGEVVSTGLSFTYGTIEFRAKLAGGQGPWPAIWLLGFQCQPLDVYWATVFGSCAWPAPGSDEIDITEILSSKHTFVNQEIHTGVGLQGGALHNDGCTAITADTSLNYHVYDLVWTAGSLIWKIDGTTTCTIQKAYVPSTSMFLIIDAAIGGTGGGTVTNSSLPQSTSVDYVKITQP